MPGRKFDTGSGYRYGFNGKEKDNSTGEGHLDFGARICDSRIGRFLSTDPMAIVSPGESSYIFAGNNPIGLTDFDGLFKISPFLRVTFSTTLAYMPLKVFSVITPNGFEITFLSNSF